MLRPLDRQRGGVLCEWAEGVYKAIGAPERLRFARTAKGAVAEAAQQVDAALDAMSPEPQQE